MIYQPKKTIRTLVEHQRTNGYGWLLIILFSILYTITVKQFDWIGLVPITDQFLLLPSKNYYHYEALIILPVTLGAVVINYGINKSVIKGQPNSNLWGIVAFATIIPALVILWFYETVFIIILSVNFFILDIIRISLWVLWTIYLTNRSMAIVNKNQSNQVMTTMAAIITLLFMVLFFR
jgi:hypothetical protein